MTTVSMGCIDFDKRLADCRAGNGGCTLELTSTDGGAECDGGRCATCAPACGSGETCFEGACLGRSCVEGTCSADQVCLGGRCTQTTCLRIPCDSRFTCVQGSCVSRVCGASVCLEGAACVGGACVDVTCVGVVCDEGQCHNGSCQDPNVCHGKSAGQSCAENKVCSAAGVCIECAAGLSCASNPRATCFEGLTSCATGTPTCIDAKQAPTGTECGGTLVCNSSGSCVSCEAGKSCGTNPSKCRFGVTSCGSGASVCADGEPKKAGEVCGVAAICDGAGFCGLCAPGEACATNPNPCFAGITACTAGLRTCVDGAPKTVGASCGTNQVCDPAHTCTPCVSGASCTTNPGAPCAAGTTQCTTGRPTCVDSAAPQSTTFYRDADQDGAGDPRVTQAVCGMKPKAPTGYVSNKDDCCDTDADAKPGQKGYFTKANACGNFDYDCSGSPDFQYDEGFTGCSFASVCAANGLGTPCEGDGKAGWGAVMAEPMGRQKAFSPATGVPGCGETGTFVNGCGKVKDCNGDNCACGHKDACEFDVTAGKVQPCH